MAKVFSDAGGLQKAGRSLRNGLHLLRRVLWPLGRIGKSTRALREGKVWAQRLEEEKESLRSLADVMEVEFVSLSEGLMRLDEQLTHIQRQCLSLTNLTAGRTEDAAIQFAFQLLKKVEDLLLASYDQYDHVFAAFHELQGWLAQLPKQHDELLRALLPLSMITTAFRIEASRHPGEVQEVFAGLALNQKNQGGHSRVLLKGQFRALPVTDPLDGERVACYRSFLPAANSLI